MNDFQIETELLAPGIQLAAHKEDIWSILEATDKDFVPPLSSRKPITLGHMEPATALWALPIEHLDFIMKLHVIIAKHGGKVVGFISFEPNFVHPTTQQFESTVLVDTIAVPSSWRRRGVARSLYAALFSSAIFQQHKNAVLHTWSTNNPHGELIDSIGFKEIDRIVNERGPGIDTVIYHRATRPNPFES